MFYVSGLFSQIMKKITNGNPKYGQHFLLTNNQSVFVRVGGG